MKEFLGKFSLSLILRQFFCGVVFCVPCILAFSPMGADLNKFSGLSSEALIAIAVISLITGTVIYHIEKNAYSYFIQCLLLLLLKIINRKKNELFTIVIVVSIALVVSFALLIFYAYISLAIIVGIIAILLIMYFSGIASFYQKVWSIDKPKKSNTKLIVIGRRDYDSKNEQAFGKHRGIKPYLILGHLDTWSDNIHCVQCCCFAWLSGIVFTNWIASHGSDYCVFQCNTAGEIIHGSISAALKSPDCLCVYVLLILEVLFEFHRFYHLYKITEESSEW